MVVPENNFQVPVMELAGWLDETGLSAQENTDKLKRRTAIDFITFLV